MNARLVQCFFAALALANGRADGLNFTDVNGRRLSTADGRTSIVTVVTRATEHDARVVGDRVPLKFYGDPNFRFITVIDLRNFPAAMHGMVLAWIRHRVTLEAERLRPVYQEQKIQRDPREDVFVVGDFDGSAAGQFGVPAGAKRSSVFLFAGDGRLVASWKKPPPADDLEAALTNARR
jgi:hypothetical protein